MKSLELLERIAVGIERLAEDPVLEMEVGPPVCPNCGILNPEISVDADESRGKLFEFFVPFLCEECKQPFIGLPVQWSMHVKKETLEYELLERTGNFNDDDGRTTSRDETSSRAS